MEQNLTLCTTSEIADRYGFDASTVRRWVLKGQLKPALTTPGGHHRFFAADVDRFLGRTPEVAEAITAA